MKRLFAALAAGRSPASLVEEEDDGPERARVTGLLMTGQTDGDTDELITMVRQCLDRIRAERIDRRLKELQEAIATLGPDEKRAAMNEYLQLNAQRRSLSAK